MPLAFDLFAGTGSATQALVDGGWCVIKIELEPKFTPDVCADVMDLTAADLLARFGRPDFVWASPPCTTFSVASMWRHWSNSNGERTPKTDQAKAGILLVEHTLALLRGLAPTHGWLMENPRGMLRKLTVVDGLERSTVTYCQYGDDRMKPTDLWGGVDGWLPSRRCSNGDGCHPPAPRGARTGTQGLPKGPRRSMVPYGLSKEVADRLNQAIMESKDERLR